MDKGQRLTSLGKGVSRLATGELLVRVRVPNPATGKYRDVARKMPADTGEIALLEMRRSLLEASDPTALGARKRFGDYAEEAIAQKIKMGIIGSPATKEKYRYLMSGPLKDAWGDVYLDAITRPMVKKWLASLGALCDAKKYKPNTVNDWWHLFKAIMVEACADFDLSDPTAALHAVSTSKYRTYTKREPNTLFPEELPAFFRAARDVAIDHYAMLALGMLTGRRTCELLPLRHVGEDSDLNWKTGELDIRRSYTVGEAAMEVTKTKKDLVAYLPASNLDILREHVGRLGGERKNSELLFPPKWLRSRPTEAGFQSRWGLRKPLMAICARAGITRKLTPKGAMRRTFQNLCRAADVRELVQMSMSGHATKEMMELYSTVAETEGRAALTKMSAIAGLT